MELAIPDDKMTIPLNFGKNNRLISEMCIKDQGLIDFICMKEYNDKKITKTGIASKRSVCDGGF